MPPNTSAFNRRQSTTEVVILIASEDTQGAPQSEFQSDTTPLLPTDSRSLSDLPKKQNYETIGIQLQETEDEVDEDFSLLKVKNIIPIEIALFLNVFLSAFDGTITNSTYATIGSEFQAANMASWITTSYMITSTSFQPLYGSFSDVLGRRACYFFATLVFALGCAGCALSKDIYTLFIFRAITGIGGGGLLTISTIINSDLIPISKRGLFQGFQNILVGVGLILGASLGGVITETVGWRFCFMGQVPISLIGLIFGYIYLDEETLGRKKGGKGFRDVDIWGSMLLITGLSAQLAAISTNSPYLIVASIVLLFAFLKVETNPSLENPIIPFNKIQGWRTYLPLFFSFATGFSSLGYIFILPLLFQITLGDSPSKAGLRLSIPSTFTMVGALITAYFMNRNIKSLRYLISAGLLTLAIGNALTLLISPSFPESLINILLIPTNTGGGMSNPSGLFSFVFQFPKSMQASTTSTLYLFRAIGQVWGISVVSTIIQLKLKSNLIYDLKHNYTPELSEHRLQEIVYGVTRSITYVKTLPYGIQEIVKDAYQQAIKDALVFTTVVSFIGFLSALVHGWWKKSK